MIGRQHLQLGGYLSLLVEKINIEFTPLILGRFKKGKINK